MNTNDKKQLRAEKKAYRKAGRKAIRPWKGLSVFLAVVCVICTIANVIVGKFDNTLSIVMGTGFWELKNEDKNAIYFQSEFASKEEKRAYEEMICEQVEAEGAALLLNRNNALPLDKGAKVSCFSNSSVNLVYGGTGSGNIDASKAPTLKSALTDAGFFVNEILWDFYAVGEGSEYQRTPGSLFAGTSAMTVEVPWDVYTEAVKDSVSQYGDAVIVTISRVGGEGSDVIVEEYNDLELNADEIRMFQEIAAMKHAGKVNKIIVLINSANAMELDFLKEEAYQIDACLWIGDVGETGINAVADILAGDITPSGHIVDTFCNDNFAAPAMRNFIVSKYTNAEEMGLGSKTAYYVIYQEGIYVGYRYFETRYEDYVMGTGNAGAYSYEEAVAYPFGFGLSYTEFSYSDMQVSYEDETDQFAVTITVTNVGDTYSGKETVQIYAQSPYTQYDKENLVEKSSVSLCGFGKTKELAPGESETLTIYVDKRDLASYDAYGAGTYILDAGTYYLTAAKNAHDAVNNVLAAKDYTVENTNGRMDADGDRTLTYAWEQEKYDSTTYSLSAVTGYEITNQFDHADLNRYDGMDTAITYLSRQDWVGTYPSESVKLTASEQLVADLGYPQYKPDDYESMSMPVMGADNGLTLYDMMGLAYDDPQWELLLDQLTFKDMESQIGDAFHWVMPLESVQSPGSRDENGPQGLTASLFVGSDVEAMGFTSEDVMAATFNRELIAEVGRCIGADCLDAGVSSLYGPGNNIHRTPYGGRNFEYYSEDGYLSGEISAVEVAAIEANGVDVLMKHFALNDCEEHRAGLCTWANEQSIREIYLKAFQAPVEDSGANGVMTAYNRLGATWAGGDYHLVTNVLRNEWGCNGRVITDNANAYMNFVDTVMAGGTLMDAMDSKTVGEYKNDPVVVTSMREAVHRNLYALLNSCAMNGVGANTTVKAIMSRPILLVRSITVIAYALLIACVVMWITRKQKFVREHGKKV